MRITFLGHATLLIETEDHTILTDPVFSDPFGDGVRKSCPLRSINPEALPPIDFLFLSHHHNDHFDIPSLAILPARVNTVLCANSPQLLHAFSTLGFGAVVPIKDYQQVTDGSTKLVFTPSTHAVPEHGLLVTDPNGKLWDQVDTIFDLEHLRLLQEDGLPIDVHLANFNPLLTVEYMTNGSLAFPAEVYEELLEVPRVVEAKRVVPFASGQVFTGRAGWINPFFFPVAHDRFIEDISSLGTRSRGLMANPGDVIEIVDHEVRLLPQARPELVRMVDPSLAECRWNPTSPVPPLRDENPYDISEPQLAAAVEHALAQIDRSIARRALVAQGLMHWAARMSICIHFPDGPRHWHIDFGQPTPHVAAGEIAGNYNVELTASGIHGMANGLMWDSVGRGGYRSFDSLYRIRAEGISRPKASTQGRMRHTHLPTPFDVFFVLWGPSFDPYLERQLELGLKRRKMLS